MTHSEVAPGLLIVETQVANGKAGVIAGTEVALAVDAGIDDVEGAAVLAAAESLGRDDIRLVYTHGHVDHALGGTAFVRRPIYARPEAGVYMRTQLGPWAERSGESTDDLDARLGWPTEAVNEGTSIDLGDRQVRLIDSPGHAPGAICVFDPDSGVLFGGDTVVTEIPPAFSDGNGVTLAATLRRLAKLDAKILVPGHGDVVIGMAAVRDAIEWSASYLERCHRHVEANAGATEEDVVASAPYDDYVGERLHRERHRMTWRHEQTLRTMLRQSGQATATRHV